ncbi:MAG: Endo,4-beta-xylanase precursor, partial [Myxococcaceae bacterium]|nr:Endo,4-beta-xylanase precursor [Myxococcaceae bacterium]
MTNAAPQDEMVGETVLGRYRIVARLAKGGMGVVYLARAEGAAGFAKPVVVKRVLPDLHGDERMARLFVREARILSNLQHPNIVSVTDFGEEAGAYIMVLDYVRAYHLGRWRSYRQALDERFPVEVALHVMIKVLDALEYAHTLTMPDGTPLEIVHADISPANILVDTDGQVKLLDFGIARMAGEVTQSADPNSIRGKFSYLPVEALDGSPPRVATDVYACGVTLYELLAGGNPFTGADETRTLAKVISHEPPPISQVRPEVRAELDAILARAISKDRAKRFASAKDFARELRRLQTVPEDEATRTLSALAKRDYAAMPSKPGTSLPELEEAWRNPVPSTRAAGDDPAQTEAPTRIDRANELAPEAPKEMAEVRPPARRGQVVLFLALGLVFLGGVAGAIGVFLSRKPADEPRFVLIEHNAASASAAANGSPTITAVAATAPVPTSADSSHDTAAGSAKVTATRSAKPA